MSDCRFGVSPVNYPDPDPERFWRRRSLEMVDGRTDDAHRMDDGACLYYKLTNEQKGSGELKTGIKMLTCIIFL